MSKEIPKTSSSLSRGIEEQKQEVAERIPGSSSLSRAMQRERHEESEAAIKEREERRKKDQARVEELRKGLGISTENPLESTAGQIKNAFEALGGSVKDAARNKLLEYDARIRVAMAGKPLKEGDTPENLNDSFRGFAKRDWSEDFK